MSALQPQPPREPIGYDEKGRAITISKSWYRFIAIDLFNQVSVVDDLDNASSATAGLAELQSEIFALQAELGAAQSLICDLRAQLFALEQRVSSLEIGTVQ